MAFNILFSQYGDMIEARIHDGKSPGCELIKGVKGKIGDVFSQKLGSLRIPIHLVREEGGEFMTNNLKLFNEILDIPPMDEPLKTDPGFSLSPQKTKDTI
ncbi:MAG: hypothetical protein PHN60_00105 [Candidatus Gracilibacteria bacterium]|nr:hypothetical protein [Candidatus Gracilibacteria bacterium]